FHPLAQGEGEGRAIRADFIGSSDVWMHIAGPFSVPGEQWLVAEIGERHIAVGAAHHAAAEGAAILADFTDGGEDAGLRADAIGDGGQRSGSDQSIERGGLMIVLRKAGAG